MHHLSPFLPASSVSALKCLYAAPNKPFNLHYREITHRDPNQEPKSLPERGAALSIMQQIKNLYPV